MWDSGRPPPPLFFQNSHIFPLFFGQRPLVTNKQTYGKFGCGEAQEENKQN